MIQFNPSIEDVHQILASSDLPTEDLQKLDLSQFIGYYENDTLCALVGLENFGREALLRSLAVSSDFRSRGIGLKLVREIEKHAQENNVRIMYLLTNTAELYFSALGYETIQKENAPVCIKQCEEFRVLCPDSAIVMRKELVCVDSLNVQ